MQKRIKHLSLFSGCGGMDIGFRGDFTANRKFFNEKEILNTKVINDLWTHCPRTLIDTVFANDIKISSRKFWERNLIPKQPSCKFHHGSIVDLVKEHKLTNNIFPKEIDIVTGGFPCQDFSISGLQKGFHSHKSHKNDFNVTDINETRGMLYSWMKKVIEITNPKLFVAENVKGLVDLKDVFNTVKKDFSSINNGFSVFSKIVFAPNYGIPQSRKRIFFIGMNNDFINNNAINLNDVNFFPEESFSLNNDLFSGSYDYPKSFEFFHELKEPDISDDLSQASYSKAKLTKGQGNSEINLNGFAPTIRSEHHGNIEFRYLGKEFGGKNIKNDEIQRRLTVRECARIQTFPDDLEFVFNAEDRRDNLSASEGYKLVGDAVPPLLAYKIALHLQKIITQFD